MLIKFRPASTDKICMKIALLCLSGLFLSGCALGSIRIKIRPDLSGTVVVTKTELVEADTSELPRIAGASLKKRTEFKLRSWEYEFTKLSDLSIGGITFRVSGDDNEFVVDMQVPIDPAAQWFQDLTPDEENSRKLQELVGEVMAEGIPALVGPRLEKVPQIGITLEFPGSVRSKQVVSSEAPSFLSLNTGDGTEAERKRQASLTMTPADVLKCRPQRVVVRMAGARSPSVGLSNISHLAPSQPKEQKPAPARSQKPQRKSKATKKSAIRTTKGSTT